MPTLTELPNNCNKTWWKDPSLRRNFLAATVCYFSSFAQGYDGAYFGTCQALPLWQQYFNFPSGTRLGLFSAAAYLPALVLLPFFSLACDKFGRRIPSAIGATGIIVGAIIGALAKNEGTLIAGRILVGTPGSLLLLSANLLLNEILHPRLRSIGSALYLSAYYIGSSVGAWVGYAVVDESLGEWSWRLVTLLQALGPIVFLTGLVLFVPESPRFLIAKGRKDEAHRMLARHHANGSMDDPLVLREMEEIEEAIERETVNKQGFKSFLATPGNRRRLLIICTVAIGSQANGVSIFSYYLPPVLNTIGVTSARQQTAINGGLNVYNLFLALFGACSCEKFGRRPLWIYATATMLVSYSCLIGLSAGYSQTGSSAMGVGVLVFIFLAFGAYDLRAPGMAFFVWLQYLTVTFNQFVNPVGLEAGGWRYYFLFWCILVVLLVIIVLAFPETKGRTLEEVALIFDGENALGDAAPVEPELEKSSSPAKSNVEHVEDLEKKGSA